MANKQDATHGEKEDIFNDVDRMVNEGLGGGNVTINNGYIGDSTTDTMGETDSMLDPKVKQGKKAGSPVNKEL
ncbi:MAG TPA: hypothetical protein VF260_11330 [Bacilli bacterium]